MKLQFYKILLLALGCLGAIPSDAGESTGAEFCERVKNLTGITIVPHFITPDIDGYMIPPFDTHEENRNHYDDRPHGSLTSIKSLVMHYTVCDFPTTLNLFTKDIPDGRVSASYVISETDEVSNIPGGKIVQIAPDSKRTWHAGVSRWREIINLNGRSLGIENVNKGFIGPDASRQWYSFDPVQIDALGKLSQAIVRKYHIQPAYIVGHSDIAPLRKSDPGILFPWEELYANYGVGAWLDPEEQNDPSKINQYCPKEQLPGDINVAFMSTYLKEYGYNVEVTAYISDEFKDTLKAFKAHFSYNQRPEQYNSDLTERDLYWVWALASKYKAT